jgi:hypothetical protein
MHTCKHIMQFPNQLGAWGAKAERGTIKAEDSRKQQKEADLILECLVLPVPCHVHTPPPLALSQTGCWLTLHRYPQEGTEPAFSGPATKHNFINPCRISFCSLLRTHLSIFLILTSSRRLDGCFQTRGVLQSSKI